MSQHTLIILNRLGDTRYTWALPEEGVELDAQTEAAIAEARAAFEAHTAKGYVAFETKIAEPETGTVVKKFRQEAERLTMVPQYVGG